MRTRENSNVFNALNEIYLVFIKVNIIYLLHGVISLPEVTSCDNVCSGHKLVYVYLSSVKRDV